MKRIFNMALKDLRILSRDKMGAFFILGFPILMGLFFGLMMNGMGSGGGSSKMKIAIVDQDDSEISRKFVEILKANDSLEIELVELNPAKESVRKGNRTGLLMLEEGFGETAGVFWGDPPTIHVGVDESRMAEKAMLQGFVMEGVGQLVAERFQNPDGLRESIASQRTAFNESDEADPATKLLVGALFGSVESMIDNLDALNEVEDGDGGDGGAGGNAESNGATGAFNFANMKEMSVAREVEPDSIQGQVQKIRSQWDISFPQAMMWGILGCVAGFAISIARERTNGTMVRLQVAPVSRFEILAGKALACFLTVLIVIAMMTALGMFLGMRPANFGLLVLAALCVSVCFVGIMMVMSVLGKTEQSVSGSGWAINMVMAMLGGCMIPVMFMPSFIQKFSVLSPIKWGILAIEGAIWREFSFTEMLFPCSILLGVGVVGLVVGTAILRKMD